MTSIFCGSDVMKCAFLLFFSICVDLQIYTEPDIFETGRLNSAYLMRSTAAQQFIIHK